MRSPQSLIAAAERVLPICLAISAVRGSRKVQITALLAGKRAAVIQSLLATARANGFEPLTWLSDTLEKLPAWPNSRIDELLPIRKQEAAQA